MDVAGAARRTLASGSARVWECRFFEPTPRSEADFSQFAEGVADLARVRVRMRRTIPTGWDYLSERLLERFPWLDDEEDDDDEDSDEGVTAVVVHAGTAAFFGGPDLWFAMGKDKGDPSATTRGREDPLWILEALTAVDEVAPRSDDRELVRGASCRRLRFRIDAELVTGDVWIDDEERVRRVTWRRAFKRRPRSPLKLPPFTSWRTVELWDFGIDVDIEIPTPTPPEPGPPLREIYAGIGALWRRKRAYDRQRGDL